MAESVEGYTSEQPLAIVQKAEADREKKNKALREWRKAHRGQVNAYMKAWRIRRAQAPPPESHPDRLPEVSQLRGNPPSDDEILLAAVDELLGLYHGFAWESQVWATCGLRRSPFLALILFGLSVRTRDRPLVEMCGRFFQQFPRAEVLLTSWPAGRQKLQNFVRPRQFTFVESAVGVMARNGGAVPQDQMALKRIWGVGDKIAECVAAYGWGKEGLPVDENVRRVVDRVAGLGAGGPVRDAAHIRRELKRAYRTNHAWMAERGLAMIDLHELLRLHGQVVCAKSPECRRCPIAGCHSRRQGFNGPAGPAVSATVWQDWRDLLLEPVGQEGPTPMGAAPASKSNK